MKLDKYKLKKIIFNALVVLLGIYFISNFFLKLDFKFPYAIALILILWSAVISINTDNIKPGTTLWRMKDILSFKPLDKQSH
jgi:FtsH-binding integral membrane protein